MSEPDEISEFWGEEEIPTDEYQESAEEEIESFFKDHCDDVFFSRQIEVRFEDRYFHWVSNRAIRRLVELGRIQGEARELRGGTKIHLLWSKKYRYYKRSAAEIIRLVEEYASPEITASVGRNGELLVLHAFARKQFVLKKKIQIDLGAGHGKSRATTLISFSRKRVYGTESR